MGTRRAARARHEGGADAAFGRLPNQGAQHVRLPAPGEDPIMPIRIVWKACDQLVEDGKVVRAQRFESQRLLAPLAVE